MSDELSETAETSGINTYRESTLHVELKSWYAQTGDRFEVTVDGYVVDVVRESLLIEIQTQNFSALKPKLQRLLPDYSVRVVYPLAMTKQITKIDSNGQRLGQRKSPKKGHLSHVVSELVYIYQLVSNPNFSLEVLLIEVEEVRQRVERRRWRNREWGVADRRLLQVMDSVLFPDLESYGKLIPDGLPPEFTTKDLMDVLRQSRRVAQQMAYCLTKLRLIRRIGKRGNAYVYCDVR